MPARFLDLGRTISRASIALGLLAPFALLALTPPVLALRTGAVRTLAYEPDGKSRTERVIGPLASRVGGEPWLPGSDVSPACRAALVAAEDVRFYRHFGIDPTSIRIALHRNWMHGRIVWGGSTLTQQLVKNLFLTRERSVSRKLREVLGATLLDRIASKPEQITWYLNVVELGPRIYGLESAAQHYFGEHARGLSLAQCVALFAMLPDPVRSHRALLGGAPDSELSARMHGALRALERARALPAEEIAAARAALRGGVRAGPSALRTPLRAR